MKAVVCTVQLTNHSCRELDRTKAVVCTAQLTNSWMLWTHFYKNNLCVSRQISPSRLDTMFCAFRIGLCNTPHPYRTLAEQQTQSWFLSSLAIICPIPSPLGGSVVYTRTSPFHSDRPPHISHQYDSVWNGMLAAQSAGDGRCVCAGLICEELRRRRSRTKTKYGSLRL